MQEQFYKYKILKVIERVRTSLEQSEAEVPEIIINMNNKWFLLFDIEIYKAVIFYRIFACHDIEKRLEILAL